MIKGLVSVITPVYNGAEFLDRSIKSVLAQNYTNWELILIDDKSKDNSIQKIQSYAVDHRIKLLKNESNSGISATRNKGIEEAEGEYIALLDQDDEWFPEKLERQVEQFKKLDQSYGLVYSNLEVRFENGSVVDQKKEIAPAPDIQKNLELMLLTNLISSPTVLIRKTVLDDVGTFDPAILWGGDDYDLWIRIAQSYKFSYIDKVLCIRYEHQKNYSADKKRMMFKTIELAEKYVHEFGLDPEINKRIKAKHFYRFGIESLKKRSILSGLIYICKSLSISKQGFIELGKTIRNRFRLL
ncbi:MAG: glycosyltransferase [Balneola sp.]